MTSPYRQLAHKALLKLRQTNARRPILKTLVRLHNSSYHWISFFASHQGVHPKHAILNYHQFFVDNVSPTDQVLDLGSGNGDVTYDVSKKARRAVGIDIHVPSVQKAQQTYRNDNLEYRIGDITQLALNENFDVIVLSNVLEHIKDRVVFLKNIKTIAPKILIRVPMITRDWISVYKKNEGFEYRLDHTHYIEFTEETFREEIARAGLSISSLTTKFGELYAVCESRPST